MKDFNSYLLGNRRIEQKLFIIFWLLIFVGLFDARSGFSAQISDTQTLKAETIKQLGIEYLTEHEHLVAGDDTELVIDYKAGDIVLPLGSVDFNIKITRSNQNATRLPLLMTINVDGVFRRGLWMTAQIKNYADVVKPRRPIPPGTILSKDDVLLERGLVDSVAHNIATRLEDVVGFKSVRGLRTGVPIQLTYLVRAPLIKRGDRVLIVAQRGPMKITAPGVAREKGFKGSMVAVENVESKKVVYGQVVNSTMVQVDF